MSRFQELADRLIRLNIFLSPGFQWPCMLLGGESCQLQVNAYYYPCQRQNRREKSCNFTEKSTEQGFCC